MAMGYNCFTTCALFRVGVSGPDRKCSINLLGEDHAREFVGHRQSRERYSFPHAAPQGFRKTLRIAAKKNQFAGAAVNDLQIFIVL